MKIKRRTFLTVLVGFLAVFLTACSAPNTKKAGDNLPSAKTILTKAQKQKYTSVHAAWTEKGKGRTLQKAEAKYTASPTVIYVNVAAESNHYKMWVENKSSYIQMKGTSTKRWFKTKAKSGSYTSFIKSLNGNLLTPFVNLNKEFKVKKNNNGYVLSYQGKSKKVWNAIVSDAAVTSLIGIDVDDVKPVNSQVQIATDQNYQVTKVEIASAYRDDGEKKNFTVKIDQIGQVKNLSVPTSVKKNAIDLGTLGQK